MLLADRSIADLAGLAVALIVGITFHEFSHAFIADTLGDRRPRALGRVTLNPGAHIDPIGALVFVLAGFGWGRPVPVNVYALRPGRMGMAIVAAGGPAANVAVAVVAAVTFRVMETVGVSGFVLELVAAIVFFNFVLAILNFIPIPPLDGYNIVLPFLPPRTAFTVQRYAPYGIIVLLVLLLLPNSPLNALLGLANPLTSAVLGA
jgi:Zn-dependent protease